MKNKRLAEIVFDNKSWIKKTDRVKVTPTALGRPRMIIRRQADWDYNRKRTFKFTDSRTYYATSVFREALNHAPKAANAYARGKAYPDGGCGYPVQEYRAIQYFKI